MTSPPAALRRTLNPASLKTPSAAWLIGQHLRVEAADSPLRGDRRELLQQPRRSPATPEIVRHRKRDLGDARLAADDRSSRPRPPGHRAGRSAPTGRPRSPQPHNAAGSPSDDPMKAHVATFRREPIIERLDIVIVLGPRRDHAQARPIRQDHIARKRHREQARRQPRERVGTHPSRLPIPSTTRNLPVRCPRERSQPPPRPNNATIAASTTA